MKKVERQDVYAGFVTRATAFIIDIVAMTVAIIVVIALSQAVLGFFTLYGLLGQRIVNSAQFQVIVSVAMIILGTAIAIGYPVGFWALLGQTPGQWLLGVRIVRVTGKPLTVRRALLRYLGYWLSAIPLGLGFLWVLVDDRRQGWHDKLAGTYVVYESRSTYRHRVPT
ncbi:MAG TPA: RDD family protein [Ktedonobacterales bacterium]